MNWFILFASMILVESSGDDSAVGDNGKSLGCLQIQVAIIEDVNRWYKTDYKSYDRLNRTKSKGICKLWLTRRMRDAEKATGNPQNYEMAFRLWNGGYRGYLHNRSATDAHWAKAKAAVIKIEKEIDNAKAP